MTDPMTNELNLKLRPDIQVARQGGGIVVLVGEFSSKTIRMSGASARLIDLLVVGCSREDLCDRLQKLGYSRFEVEPAIDTFLHRLSSTQLLQSETDAYLGLATPMRPRMINIDPLASLLARPFQFLPFGLVMALECMISVMILSIITMAALKGLLLPSGKDLRPWALWGLLGVVPWMFLHELSHATVCRAVGCRVSGLGVRFHKWRAPVPFVDTRYVVLLKSRWAKAWVALAGPLMDMILLGLISLAILVFSADSKIIPSLHLLFFIISAGFFFNLNPWRISDGSNAVGALTDNAYLPISAFTLKAGRKGNLAYFCYRLWVSIYLLTFLVAIGYFTWKLYIGLMGWIR